MNNRPNAAGRVSLAIAAALSVPIIGLAAGTIMPAPAQAIEAVHDGSFECLGYGSTEHGRGIGVIKSADGSTPDEVTYECTSDGVYQLNLYAYSYGSWGSYYSRNGNYIEVHEGATDGRLVFSNQENALGDDKYANLYTQMIPMKAGETYHFLFWTTNDTHSIYASLWCCSQRIEVSSSPDSVGTHTVQVTTENCYDVSTGDVGDLALTYDWRNSLDRSIEVELAPGETKSVWVNYTVNSAIAGGANSQNDWRVRPKYETGYSYVADGTTGGAKDPASATDDASITYTFSEAANTGDTTAFHSVGLLDEIVEGAHYVLAVKAADGNYYALAADEYNHVTPVALTAASVTDWGGTAFDGFTLDVPTRDVSEGDYVLTCSATGGANDDGTSATGVKLKTNYKDAATGKQVSLKMGRYSGDSDVHLFMPSSGSLNINAAGQEGVFEIRKSTYGHLGLVFDGSAQYTINIFYGSYGDVVILTDAKKPEEPEPDPEPEGAQLFERIGVWSINSSEATDLLFVCENAAGEHYALTKSDMVKIDNPTGEELGAQVETDIANAWSVGAGTCAWRYGDDWAFLEMSGAERDGSRLDAASDTLVSSADTASASLLFGHHWTDDQGDQYEMWDADPYVCSSENDLFKWDETTNKLTRVTSPDDATHFEVYRRADAASSWKRFYQTTDLEAIGEWDHILVTYTDASGNRFMLLPTTSGALATVPVTGTAEQNNTVCYPDGSAIAARLYYSATPGAVKSAKNGNYKLDSLTWSAMGGMTLYLDGYVKNGSMVDTKAKECMFSYNDDGQIVLRGAKQWLALDENGKLVTTTDKSEALPIEVWAVDDKTDATRVRFHDVEGDVISDFTTQGKVTLSPLDGTVKDGTTYAFVGWTADPSKSGLLSLDDSCNLYDFDDVTKTGSVTSAAAEKNSLIGSCNPESPDSVDPSALATDGTLDLYPVYAVRGFSTAVTADDGDTKIVGISDWKDLQPDNGDYSEREQWLGKIYCNVYLDGELWVESQPMYFRYHNDDAADLNLKFIDDELLAGYAASDDPLHSFMSDSSVFPAESQKGFFTIDAVTATQGGSEDGLKYRYNWLTDHGGQLDNVKGGSTVNVYVTSLYKVRYYLDGEELTGDAWQNANVYATPGTANAFADDSASADYLVTATNDNHALMDKTISDGSTFANDAMVRGDYSAFAYKIADHNHTIPIAELPEAPDGRTLVSTTWDLDAEDGKVYEPVKPSAPFDVTGTVFGTGDTFESWTGFDEKYHTFHLYAYTKVTPGTPPDPATPPSPTTSPSPETPTTPGAVVKPATPATGDAGAAAAATTATGGLLATLAAAFGRRRTRKG